MTREQSAVAATEAYFGAREKWSKIATAYYRELIKPDAQVVQKTVTPAGEPTERVIARVVPFYNNENDHLNSMS